MSAFSELTKHSQATNSPIQTTFDFEGGLWCCELTFSENYSKAISSSKQDAKEHAARDIIDKIGKYQPKSAIRKIETCFVATIKFRSYEDVEISHGDKTTICRFSQIQNIISKAIVDG